MNNNNINKKHTQRSQNKLQGTDHINTLVTQYKSYIKNPRPPGVTFTPSPQ